MRSGWDFLPPLAFGRVGFASLLRNLTFTFCWRGQAPIQIPSDYGSKNRDSY